MSISLYLTLSIHTGPFLVAKLGFWGVFAIALGVAAGVLIALYFVGKRMQKKQDEAQAQIDQAKQTVSILVIDKKKLKAKNAGLPEAAMAAIPWYAKNAKMPVVKAKIGPQIMSLIADQKVYDIIPVKKECKVALSGMYITELKSVRGGKVPEKPAKVNFFKRTLNNLSAKIKKTENTSNRSAKKK